MCENDANEHQKYSVSDKEPSSTVKSTILSITAILILSIIVLAAFRLYFSESDFDGSCVRNPDSYMLSIRKMNGRAHNELELCLGDIMDVQFETMRGAICLEIKAPNGSTIYQGDGKTIHRFSLGITESGSYTILIEAKDAKGVINIRCK